MSGQGPSPSPHVCFDLAVGIGDPLLVPPSRRRSVMNTLLEPLCQIGGTRMSERIASSKICSRPLIVQYRYSMIRVSSPVGVSPPRMVIASDDTL